MPVSSRTLRWIPLLASGVLFGLPTDAFSQPGARLRLEENFRREANGVVLARLAVGTPLLVMSEAGNWSEVELEGWVWLQSVDATDREGLDLVVSVTDGENLRASPAGPILGRLEEGALLEEVARDAAWARVRRRGWVWSASLEVAVGESPTSTPTVRIEPAARAPGGFANAGRSGAPILTAPDGDTLALAAPDSDLEILRREGNWVRVRVEGWLWMPPGDAGTGGGEAEAPVALDPSDLLGDPAEHAGRVVAWTLQFISLERAEAVRTDFFEGEPFLLARFGGGDGAFVYVAVPPERLADVEGLVPLERISVTGRVRTGASALTGTPIVELITLERPRGDS